MERTMPKAKPKTARKSAHDAIALLTEDHRKVKKMFKDFEKLKKGEGNDGAKTALVDRICTELTVHVQVEEEIFYPAVRAAIDDNDLMDEADVEHAGAKDLIAQLAAMKPGDDHYDAKVTVLGEYIEHHVKEEHDELFPQARKARVDTGGLGAQILQRKQELQQRGGASAPPKNASVYSRGRRKQLTDAGNDRDTGSHAGLQFAG
jgi:hemerythrin-like domain-containing protein